MSADDPRNHAATRCFVRATFADVGHPGDAVEVVTVTVVRALPPSVRRTNGTANGGKVA